MDRMALISKQRICCDLQRLGIYKDATVMMHSSLSALGNVDGGAEAVVDAILDAIGTGGTLLVPAFRDSIWGNPCDFAITDGCPCQENFCASHQPGFQGIIAETVRKRKGSFRSCHPTHSWAALGPAAESLLAGHRNSPTPCGIGNPFEQLVKMKGCILTLGVGVNTITLWHYYEEILGVPYMGHYWPKERHLNHCVSGLRIQYQYPGIMQEVCRIAGILTTGSVGKSVSGLMEAYRFDEFMATIMANDPFCLVLRPPDRFSDNLGIDALRKAKAMIEAWNKGVCRTVKNFGFAPQPILPAVPNDTVRTDCPAFAGYHDAEGKSIALCHANGRHPDLFRLGGIFNECGVTTCSICSWNELNPAITF